jgi:Ca-activated chloride channel family protein
MGGKPDYYVILGLVRNASQEEIRRAYLKSVQRLHPDKNENPGETEMFLEVQQAYEVLADPKRRSQYDATLPPEPVKPKLPISQSILLSRKCLFRMKEQQILYALLQVTPDESLAENAAPPLNFCLLLDLSTSMKGEKLDVVKATAIQLMQKLRPQDIFSVVTFSDKAEVIIPSSRNIDMRRAQNRIQMLNASGGTEIFQGLQTAVEEIRQYLKPGGVNHIILLTDGQTYGDERACLELAQQVAEQSISISGLGIGNSWNDIFLDALASRTGGNCMYVNNPQDIQQLLTDKFDHLAQIIVEEVTLQFKTEPEVEMSYAFRLQPEASPLPLESPIRMGPILKGKDLSVLIEFQVKPGAIKSDELTLLDGQINATMSSSVHPIPPLMIEISRPVSIDVTTDVPPPEIVHALSRLTIYRIQEKARQEVSSGDYDKAAEHLQRMATHLLAQGERALAKTVLLEAENIQKQKAFSENGEKQIKFGTRALLLPGEIKQ